MRLILFLAAALLSIFQCTYGMAGDIPGSRDPAGFKRFQGSQIVHYATVGYTQYKLAGDGDWKSPTLVEGALTRIAYLAPDGVSPLEVFRNYQQMFAAAGYQQTLALTGDQVHGCCGWFFVQFFHVADMPGQDAYYQCAGGEISPEYATFKGASNGNDVYVALFVSGSNGCSWGNPDLKTPIAVSKGRVVVGLDVITSKALQDKMVVVKAADIADALATKGVFDLYGVYFDTDKTDVKPESTATLDEVASLLKIDRSLRLEVSGHTDNTGTKDHNLRLSQGRAQAVVAFLASHYGIDPKRLVAKGYGDARPVAPNDNDADKAKNRRVELRKL